MENILPVLLLVTSVGFIIYTAIDILNNKVFSHRVKTNLLGFIFFVPFFGSFAYLCFKRSDLLKKQ
jgi:hypothetical protein